MQCQCQQEGYCPIFNRIMAGRTYQLCREDSAKADVYKQNWLNQAKKDRLLPIVKFALSMAPPQLIRFIESCKRYTDAGSPKIQDSDYVLRIEMCEKCDSFKNGECMECGCYVYMKAKWPTEQCPKNKWPKISLPVLTPQGGCGCKK